MTAFRAKPPKGAPLDRADPLAKGLVGAYLFNEVAGDKLRDAAGGKAGDATLTNFALGGTASNWVSGRYGKSLDFDGTNDYIETPQTTGVVGGLAILVTPRFAPNTSARYLFDSQGSRTLLYQNTQATGAYGLYIGGTTVSDTPTGLVLALPQEVPTLVGITWGGGTVRVYRGGKLFASFGVTVGSSSGALRFGSRFTGADYWLGGFDAVYMWSGVVPGPGVFRRLAADPFRAFRRRSVPVPLSVQVSVSVSGTASITEAADTVSATGAVAVTGTAIITEAADGLSASATVSVSVSGTASITEAADTLSASGAVAVAVTTTTAVAESADSAAGTGESVAGRAGSAALTEAPDTILAAASIVAIGTSAITEAPDTLAGVAAVAAAVTASASIVEAPDAISALASVIVNSMASLAEAADTLAASASASGVSVPTGCVCGTLAVESRIRGTLTITPRVTGTLTTDCCSTT